MTRASQTISLFLLTSSIYLLLLLPSISDSSPIPQVLPTKIQVEIIPVLPIWFVVALGAYLLGRLGLGVLMFNDTEAAFKELMGQIDGAKTQLKKRSVGTD